jgi:tetratricopeptide (TPR) repeat protein
MKKIFYTLILTTSIFVFGQKKELKQVKKLLDQEFYSEALSVLNNNKDLILNSEEKYKAHFYYLNGIALTNDLKYMKAISSFRESLRIERSIGQNKFIEDSNLQIRNAVTLLVNSAVKDSNDENYKSSYKKLYNAYTINPENEENISWLYFAAGTAVRALDYEVALDYYLKLKNIGYTGIVNKYFATSTETNIEEEVSKEEYEIFQSSKDYINFRIGKTESRLPEIVKNISLIYINNGQTEKAIESMKEARDLNPNDVGLMMSEANIYIKLGDVSKYTEIFKEALESDPTNYLIHYNLGSIRMKEGKFDSETKNYFLKSIELNDKYLESYQNLVAFILEDEKIINQKMEKLNSKARFTEKDYTQYDAFKEEKKELYKECLPLLIKMNKLDDSNIEVLRQLRGIYDALDDEENRKKMNDKIEELGY